MIDRETTATIVFFAVATPTCAVANLLFYKMVSEVNRQLPRAEKISVFWLGFGKMSKVQKLHKQFFPSSRLRLISDAAGLICIVAFAIAFYLSSTA